MTQTPAARRRRGRPAITNREDLERAAVELFQQNGYKETTLAEIAERAHVSRRTLTTYFPTKASIVWAEFAEDETYLRRALEVGNDGPMSEVIARAICESARRTIAYRHDRNIVKRRLALFDHQPELHEHFAALCMSWSRLIADYVAARTGLTPDSFLPAAIGGMCLGAYLALIRDWSESPDVDLESEISARLPPLIEAVMRVDAPRQP